MGVIYKEASEVFQMMPEMLSRLIQQRLEAVFFRSMLRSIGRILA